MSEQSVFQPNKPTRRSHGVLLVFLGLIAGLLIAAANRQAILDYVALRGYQPPAVISSIADEVAMTEEARKIFYVNHPEISSKDSFGDNCKNSNGAEKTIVLGCYHGNQGGIYLLKVEDPRLSGVEQVTAAHEMLHAAYDRLSSKERTEIDSQLKKYADMNLTDERIKSTIESYKISEPNDIINEMHSIFATEIASLPAPLENYYKRYFTDRTKVIKLANRYQAEFSSRTAAVKQFDDQLATLKAQIESQNADLKQRFAAVNAEQNRLANLRSSGNTEAFNAGVPGYNRQVDAYNSQVASVRILLDQYNALVASRNSIAIEQQQLANALDSSASPIE